MTKTKKLASYSLTMRNVNLLVYMSSYAKDNSYSLTMRNVNNDHTKASRRAF